MWVGGEVQEVLSSQGRGGTRGAAIACPERIESSARIFFGTYGAPVGVDDDVRVTDFDLDGHEVWSGTAKAGDVLATNLDGLPGTVLGPLGDGTDEVPE